MSQALFEENCENLHEMVEKDFDEFFTHDDKFKKFELYRTSLINYSNCTDKVHFILFFFPPKKLNFFKMF